MSTSKYLVPICLALGAQLLSPPALANERERAEFQLDTVEMSAREMMEDIWLQAREQGLSDEEVEAVAVAVAKSLASPESEPAAFIIKIKTKKTTICIAFGQDTC